VGSLFVNFTSLVDRCGKTRGHVYHFAVLSFIMVWATSAHAQVNSWTKPSSGNWEEPYWSLGLLPTNGHSVMITNAGWKAVTIGSSTTQTNPESLSVNSVTVSSPIDSFNVLFFNYAGLQTPLTVNSLTVASNAELRMLSSALRLNGPMGTGMSIGGEFNQEDSSLVTGNQIDIGYIGPGVYNLVSGLVNLGHVWLGGPFAGIFNQHGGSNLLAILHLESGGVYNFFDGEFAGEVYFNTGSLFRQQGGRLNAPLAIWRGTYLLENGVNYGGLMVPVATPNANAAVVQTGGTNLGPIHLGYFGNGSYNLSNGVVRPSSLEVHEYGNFFQWGGTLSCTGTVEIVGGWVNRGDRALGYYTLYSGTVSAPEIFMDTGSFTQHGGTNVVNGAINFANTTHNNYNLNGGILRDSSVILQPAWVGGFFQNGGLHVISNELSIYGNDNVFSWAGYVLKGGELQVSNVVVNSRGIFNQTGGTVTQSGLLSLVNARMYAGPGAQQFGRLQLSVEGNNTNSTLYCPTGACELHFRDSASQAWSPAATLTIEIWAGSRFGGGAQQIIFGTNDRALTGQQLAQIYFHNPMGLAAGLYSATILSSGELVPNALPPTGRVPPRLTLSRQSDGTMQLVVSGEPGANFGIEISTNLTSWTFWTNGASESGMFSVTDTNANHAAQRYYRAVLLP
jgi:hypothetical protein